MADLPPYSTPRWVKIVGIIALVVVLLVAILMLTGVGGDHGPGRHMPSGDAGDRPPSGITGDQTSFASGSKSHTLLIEHRREQP